jgi:hypothetical protein
MVVSRQDAIGVDFNPLPTYLARQATQEEPNVVAILEGRGLAMPRLTT